MATTERPTTAPAFDDRFFSARQLSEIFGVNLITIWRWSKRGHLPKPRRLTPGTTRWFGGDLNRHLASLNDKASPQQHKSAKKPKLAKKRREEARTAL